MRDSIDEVTSPAGALPLTGAVAVEEREHIPAKAAPGGDDKAKVSKGFITMLGVGFFASYVAFVTPVAISLAIQVKALAPENEEYLGLVLGLGSFAALLVGPLGGQLSDRTRSRLGRRRPWLIAGSVIGFVGLAVMASAPNIPLLGLGWIIAHIGWSLVVSNFGIIQADRLPASQRGKVGAITGFAGMVAPVAGALIGGLVATQPFLLFLLPGAIGLVGVLIFAVFYKDQDSRALTFDTRLTPKVVLGKYVYSPKKYPDFSWNFLGRFLFNFGLTLATSFTAFFFAQRLGIPVHEIGGTAAIVGGLGIPATVAGVFFGGFLSDKIRRRKAFVLGSGVLYAIGAITTILGPDLPILLVGSVTCNIAIGVFSAVDQALILDVLPERDTEAGRFMSIVAFSTNIPHAIAPIVGAGLISIGAVAGGDKNYTMVYVAAAILTIFGGIAILKVKAVR
ncbi:Na+/melibiose symporter-like transporter [Arthrobacter sp. SLBN-100]|uniref:MFS transporter n=1 Tax=Arthrobacter sp. SLBN-100 TaxID=2768450 RepID=UPI00116A1476|nr:MFS transporter [Arthrobacter sp. SLBN-100]TQJ66251.1 Na+/melibiose symporter-like transporter [Arthrobacter sp. SLBN-100]